MTSREKRLTVLRGSTAAILAFLASTPAWALPDATSVPYRSPTPKFAKPGLESMFVCGFGRATGWGQGAGDCAGMASNAVGYVGAAGVCAAPNMDPAVRACGCPAGQSADAMGQAGYFSSVPWDTEYRWFWCH
jgi:hypothetical protein